MRRLEGIALEEGDSRLVITPELSPPWRSVLLTRVHGRVRAYWNVCRHLPIPLDGGLGTMPPGSEWVCSTHGARFRTTDGVCVEGPCEGRALHPVDIEERSDGSLWIRLEPPRSEDSSP